MEIESQDSLSIFISSNGVSIVVVEVLSGSLAVNSLSRWRSFRRSGDSEGEEGVVCGCECVEAFSGRE